MCKVEVDKTTFRALEKLEEMTGKSKTELMFELVKNYIIFDLEREETKEVLEHLGIDSGYLD